jgi:hypothetical protein
MKPQSRIPLALVLIALLALSAGVDAAKKAKKEADTKELRIGVKVDLRCVTRSACPLPSHKAQRCEEHACP